jgi:ankyrin repeat protein
MFIDAGAALNIDYHRISRGNRPPLLEALKRRNKDIVTRLLDEGARPNYGWKGSDQFSRGYTSIHLAVQLGDYEVVKRLIFEDADIDHCCRCHGIGVPLSIAVNQQDEEMVKIFLQAGVGVNNRESCLSGNTPLAAATARGDMKILKLLVDYGADPNDSLALQYAVSKEIKAIVLQRYRKVYPCGSKGLEVSC